MVVLRYELIGFLDFIRKGTALLSLFFLKAFLVANAESFHFAAYQQLNFTPFLSEMDLGFLPSIFPASKSRLVC